MVFLLCVSCFGAVLFCCPRVWFPLFEGVSVALYMAITSANGRCVLLCRSGVLQMVTLRVSSSLFLRTSSRSASFSLFIDAAVAGSSSNHFLATCFILLTRLFFHGIWAYLGHLFLLRVVCLAFFSHALLILLCDIHLPMFGCFWHVWCGSCVVGPAFGSWCHIV